MRTCGKRFLALPGRIGRQPAAHLPGTPALEVDHVHVDYDGQPAIEDVDFSLQGGEELAIVGPNGAGKSTLLKAIAGVLRPTSGAGPSPTASILSPDTIK